MRFGATGKALSQLELYANQIETLLDQVNELMQNFCVESKSTSAVFDLMQDFCMRCKLAHSDNNPGVNTRSVNEVHVRS
jgi:hypothetical protein